MAAGRDPGGTSGRGAAFLWRGRPPPDRFGSRAVPVPVPGDVPPPVPPGRTSGSVPSPPPSRATIRHRSRRAWLPAPCRPRGRFAAGPPGPGSALRAGPSSRLPRIPPCRPPQELPFPLSGRARASSAPLSGAGFRSPGRPAGRVPEALARGRSGPVLSGQDKAFLLDSGKENRPFRTFLSLCFRHSGTAYWRAPRRAVPFAGACQGPARPGRHIRPSARPPSARPDDGTNPLPRGPPAGTDRRPTSSRSTSWSEACSSRRPKAPSRRSS
jgi:hypothetical protein